MNNRIVYLDSLRGFAILLVVIGHLIQFNYETGIENPIFNVIYSFHMPLFFFISGCSRGAYEAKKGEIDNIGQLGWYVWDKFITLMIPSIVWTMLVPLFFAREFIISNRLSDFWFLNTLFAVFILWGIYSYANNKIAGKRWLSMFCVSLILVAVAVGFKRIPLMYLVMFIVGYYFQRYDWIRKMDSRLYALAALGFCLLAGYFNHGSTIEGSPDRFWMEFPISMMASFALIKVAASMETSEKRITPFLAYIGKYTLGIYVCSFLFMNIKGIQIIENGFDEITQFCILLILSLLISLCCIGVQKIIEPFFWLNGIMYGKWKNKKIM